MRFSVVVAVLAVACTAAWPQQRPSPQAERANAEIARRLGQLAIDNAHLQSAVETLLEQLQAAQAKQKECPE